MNPLQQFSQTMQNAYPQRQPNFQLPQPVGVPKDGMIWVDSEDEIPGIQVKLGDSVAIFSRTENVFYVKTVDANGAVYPLRTFEYTERQQSVSNQFATKGDLAELYAKIDKLTEMLK